MCLNRRRGSKQALPCRHHLLCFRVTSKRKARTEISVGKTAGEAGIRVPLCDLTASLDHFRPPVRPCFRLVDIRPSPEPVSSALFRDLWKMDGKQVLNLILGSTMVAALQPPETLTMAWARRYQRPAIGRFRPPISRRCEPNCC